MTADLADIRLTLERVTRCRQQAQAEPGLAALVQALKAFQARRFEHTYADLAAAPRSRPAVQFFLDDLYGPHDARQRDRDQQFERILPTVSRTMPQEVLAIIDQLATLHALTEETDLAMAQGLLRAAHGHLDHPQVRPADYQAQWLTLDNRADRERQLQLVQALGAALNKLARQTWLQVALKLMRGPAKAAGLADLQHFLEQGLSAFRQLPDAPGFLSTVTRRETDLINRLCAGTGLPEFNNVR